MLFLEHYLQVVVRLDLDLAGAGLDMLDIVVVQAE